MELEGRLKVTNLTLTYFIANKSQEEEVFFVIPVGYIARSERSIEDKTTTVEISLKYGCSFKIRYS